MIKGICSHGVTLPRGLKCIRGVYLVIRLKTPQGAYNRGCGPHTPTNEKVARLALDDIRVKQRLGTFGLRAKARRMRFDEGMDVFYQKHYTEYRNPRTGLPRSPSSLKNTGNFAPLRSFFGDYYIDVIDLKALKRYRKKRVEYDGVAPGTVNKDMAILSAFFNMYERWVADGDIDAVCLPSKNPCLLLPDLYETPRDRVATLEELKALKQRCQEFQDLPLWSAIETTLITALRKGDLEKFSGMEAVNGEVTVTQGKTGGRVSFPASAQPKWHKIFTNFDSRWDRVRVAANCPDLQFRDLRKTALQMLETPKAYGLMDMEFTDDNLATKAGHSDVKITRRWYLKGAAKSKDMARMVGAAETILAQL